MRRLTLLFVVLAAWASAGFAPPPDPTPTPTPTPSTDPRARIDELFREYDRSDTPGCALGVYRDGRIEYARGYGMANLELAVANTAQTVFDIGSTSKQFAAFSIQLLAREGKLSLDDDVRKWVPEIQSYGKTVTIRHLLHHTGGLRDYIELMSLQGVMTEDLTGDADVLDIMARQKAPNFAPGEEHLYSNTGYFLLSVIVKRATGMSLRDFAAERIFAPLGMRHTQFNDSHTRIIPNRATGYSKGKSGKFGLDMSDWEQTGDGAVLTTVEDLYRWDQNFYEPKVGDAKLLEAMHATGSLNSGKKLEYASAIYVSTYRGLPAVSHGGSWAGYRAQLLRFPQQKLSVACLCNNGGTANPSRLAQKVAEVYLGDLMKPAEAKPDTQAETPAVAPAEAAGFAGAYRNAVSGQLVTLSIEKGVLTAQVDGKPYSLTPVASGRFRMANAPAAWTSETVFVPGKAGSRPQMRVTTTYEDGEVEVESFEPVERWTPSAADVAAFVGTYASRELDTTWRLVADGGKLTIRHRGISAEPMTPTVRDGFTIDGMNLAFRRAGRGVSGFTLDAGRVRGVAFVRVAE
jgi:CubicO group peptidase (beta-lactamase class C family)